MTNQLLRFIRGTCPASTAEIWSEITLAGTRKPPADLPQTLDLLARELLGGAIDGLVEERDGEWHVLPQKAPRPERTLFI